MPTSLKDVRSQRSSTRFPDGYRDDSFGCLQSISARKYTTKALNPKPYLFPEAPRFGPNDPPLWSRSACVFLVVLPLEVQCLSFLII